MGIPKMQSKRMGDFAKITLNKYAYRLDQRQKGVERLFNRLK